MRLRALGMILVLGAIGVLAALFFPSGGWRKTTVPTPATSTAARRPAAEGTPIEATDATAPPPAPAPPTVAPTEPPSVYSAVFERPIPRTPTTPAGGPFDLRTAANVHAPEILKKVEPEYPLAARKARMEGQVVVDAVLTERGEVTDPRVVRSVNPLLDASAVNAVRQWQYRPATLDGKPVRVYVTVTITFSLH